MLAAAFVASSVAVWWSWKNNAFLLYGDAEAHTHIARRLFDSHRPGLTQLGSVWLPLPHLLQAPFVAVDSWWRSGLSAVIPSAACYLLACLGLYRLARKWIAPLPASLALLFFAANPNLLYLQTTAMTEPLFLCELIWSVLLLIEWRTALDTNSERAHRLQWAIVGVLVAAVYTRYDGWILAFLAWVAMARCLARRRQLFASSFVFASIVLLAAPVGWMVYNAAVFGDWLDFMRGPYSARAIELRTSPSAIAPHPGWHNPWVSAIYFEKAAAMDAAAAGRWGDLLFFVAIVGALYAWLSQPKCIPQSPQATDARNAKRSLKWTLFLCLPLPFYAYSVSYGSVPIFLPIWVPYAWYNTRYGMELLPAFALFLGFAVAALFKSLSTRPQWMKRMVAVLLFVLLTANMSAMLIEQPLTYVEAVKNDDSRRFYNVAIADSLSHLHALDPHAVVLTDTSPFPSIIPHAGLTYRQTLNESDKEYYQEALADPAAHAGIVLAFAGDEVDTAVKAHPEHLRFYQSFHARNQPDATLYVAENFPGMVFESDPDEGVSTAPTPVVTHR